MNLNKNGQVLIVFVLLLPILVLLIGVVLNYTILTYEKNKLDNINVQVIDEYIDEKNIDVALVEEYIKKNDESIIIDKIDIQEDCISIKLTKNVDSFFAQIIGKEHFSVVSDINKKR